ncbi:MAG: fructokinase, partial [Solirubrobacteraceae bacterium]|nr:fructokinase [Solirubrobacteraceae bacterium]
MAILVGGEALYDLVVTPDEAIAAHPGGGPFNTARTIARLEQPVAYLGRLSTDRFGRSHERLLSGDGVGLDAVTCTDDPTTLALAEVDEHGGASYHFYAGGTAAAGLTPREALAALPDGVEMLHVGTLGLVLEPVASALEAVVERLAPNVLVAVDPNVRPGAIADAASYRARLDRVLARTHVVKVSGDDLDWLEPGRPWLDAARA